MHPSRAASKEPRRTSVLRVLGGALAAGGEHRRDPRRALRIIRAGIVNLPVAFHTRKAAGSNPAAPTRLSLVLTAAANSAVSGRESSVSHRHRSPLRPPSLGTAPAILGAVCLWLLVGWVDLERTNADLHVEGLAVLVVLTGLAGFAALGASN
jgi:hypothetical protein